MRSLRYLASVCSQVTPLKHLKKENLKRLVFLMRVQYVQRWRRGPWRHACPRTTWAWPREQFAPSSIPGNPRGMDPRRAEGCGVNSKPRRKLRLWKGYASPCLSLRCLQSHLLGKSVTYDEHQEHRSWLYTWDWQLEHAVTCLHTTSGGYPPNSHLLEFPVAWFLFKPWKITEHPTQKLYLRPYDTHSRNLATNDSTQVPWAYYLSN